MGIKETLALWIGLYFTVEGAISVAELIPFYSNIGPNADPIMVVQMLTEFISKLVTPSPITLFVMILAVIFGIKRD
jgi:hypothetical protein